MNSLLPHHILPLYRGLGALDEGKNHATKSFQHLSQILQKYQFSYILTLPTNIMPGAETDIATRALVVTLMSPAVGLRSVEVAAKTGLSKRLVNNIYAKAVKQGFDPNRNPISLHDEMLQNKPRSGRPSKQTPEAQEALISFVRRDRYGREKTCSDLAGALNDRGIDISASTVHRILRKAGFRKTKPTRKPGLTKEMRAARLAWCLEHKDWTLEDWKKVIWSDETSVALNQRRGGYRVWRKKDEAFVKSCLRERYKGYQEFMFWGCFTYDKKGPCHCWLPETAAEKKKALKDLTEQNALLEPIAKEAWELENGMRRLGLRNKAGPKPVWKFTKKKRG